MGLMSWWGWYREQRFALDSTLRERWADLRKRFADRRRGQAEWDRARSLDELGELTARWLEGDLRYNPTYGDWSGPDEETAEIAAELAVLNRSGFVTSGSQPGIGPEEGYDGHIWWQRAAVDGFTAPETADALEAACEEAALFYINNGPAGWRNDLSNREVVTASSVDPSDRLPPDPVAPQRHYFHTGFGAHLSRRELTVAMGGCDQRLLRGLEQVTIIDPIWGRKSYMWDVITKAITPPCCPCREA